MLLNGKAIRRSNINFLYVVDVCGLCVMQMIRLRLKDIAVTKFLIPIFSTRFDNQIKDSLVLKSARN